MKKTGYVTWVSLRSLFCLILPHNETLHCEKVWDAKVVFLPLKKLLGVLKRSAKGHSWPRTPLGPSIARVTLACVGHFPFSASSDLNSASQAPLPQSLPLSARWVSHSKHKWKHTIAIFRNKSKNCRTWRNTKKHEQTPSGPSSPLPKTQAYESRSKQHPSSPETILALNNTFVDHMSQLIPCHCYDKVLPNPIVRFCFQDW